MNILEHYMQSELPGQGFGDQGKEQGIWSLKDVSTI